MARSISYSVVGGWQLPETVEFADGRVRGYFTSLTGGGQWQTTSDLGSVNRNSAVNISLSIQPQAGASIVNYAVRGEARLPLGLYLDSTTGQMTGTVGLWPRESAEAEYRKTPLPAWTSASDLGLKNELDTVNVSLAASPTGSATSIARYHLVEGFLPWGLWMNGSGSITGTVTGIEPSEGYTERTPKPTITASTFAPVANGAVVNYAISAQAPEDQTIAQYTVIGGVLPWGLRLNSSTGAITGTVSIPTTGMPAISVYPFDVRVTTSTGAYETASFSISIS